jgi:hypothetical protein
VSDGVAGAATRGNRRDNMSAIALSKNRVLHARSKHIKM